MTMPGSSSADRKAELRRAALARRVALPPTERAQAAETIAARVFPLAVADGVVVSGYMPMKSEINPLPLLRKLAEAGARLALPVVAGSGKPLIMRTWSFGEIGDTRLTVMAALTVADELVDTGNRLRRLEEDVAGLQETRAAAVERANVTQAAVAAALNAAAERIERVTKALNQGRPVGVALG